MLRPRTRSEPRLLVKDNVLQADPDIDAVASTLAGFLADRHRLFIGGKWLSAASEATMDVVNPATGRVFASVASGAAADVDLAVRAARAAFEAGPWPTLQPSERARLLWRLADALEAHGDEFALLETLNNGMPFKTARLKTIHSSVESLRYNAGWATKLAGEVPSLSLPGEWHGYTQREPIGVVAQIVPWNAPLAISVGKIAPALAAGCTIVLKPAEQTPLTALRLAQLVESVGFPPGVVNIVTGSGSVAGAALASHPDVDKISFTGSTRVGKEILAAASGNMKRVALELGGKSPVFIFSDADIESAIEATALGIFSNSGQICAAGSRMYAHESVFDRVVDGIAERAARLKVGPGIHPETEIGPVISKEQQIRVSDYIASGRREGAKVVVGGHAIKCDGFFIEPTVLTCATSAFTAVREEIFGPVLCAMSFDGDDLEGLARQANDTVYGLSASIWTRDLSMAHRFARRIKAGNIRINAPSIALDLALPFGGYKQSGWGREFSREGVEAYTELKSVAIRL
ncbi:phenylacetaldehyde dehydrogenase [Georgfuchsia toluolica]|uniref:Phenylacetaldehyde dehydrogenase n=1 Tax=Georgfuchsia toluolica TaxID=424218 RepID=A0A916J1L3_9PROT|nr:phenylacetaldehyde dehydrogenase [Georgfuchsia toluolica]